MVDLTVNLAGLEMDNPVVPASGTFGFGKEFKDIYDINILGSFSFKGTTKDARFGNPTPRIAECTSGMINALVCICSCSGCHKSYCQQQLECSKDYSNR